MVAQVGKVEGKHTGGFIITEANGHRSRENRVVSSGQGVLVAGTVLESADALPATELTVLAGAAGGGGYAVLLTTIDTTDADVFTCVFVRDCELNKNELVWPVAFDAAAIATAKAAMALQGIIVR